MTPLENLALTIKRLQYRNYRALDARLAPLGISLVQWSALREIESNPGLCMHRLAELTFNSDQAFGTLMTRLLRRKLVERQAGTGRANVHRLTPRGKSLLAEGNKRVRQLLTRTFAMLDAGECAQLQGLLNKVLGGKTTDPESGASRTAHLSLTPSGKAVAGVRLRPRHLTVRDNGHLQEKKSGRRPSARSCQTDPDGRGGAN